MPDSPSVVKYAGFWRRALAHLIDSVFLNLLAWLGELLLFGGMYLVYLALARRAGQETRPYSDAFDPMTVQVVDAVIYLLLAAFYFIWGQARYETTLGKRWLKIRVVRASDGTAMSLRQSAGRFCAYALSYATLGCGFLMAAFHPQKRALHDLIAGTVSVIKEG